jgi:glycosyltransferase involved in cell wall biosynthesis
VALFAGAVADAALLARAKALARDLGVSNLVLFSPPIAAVERLYDGLDAIVLPSLYEGFPNVLVEAMAAGLPIAATGIEASRSALVGYSRARFVPVGSPGSLGDAVRSALLSEEVPSLERRRLLARFSPERMAREAEALYERCVAGRRGACSVASPPAAPARRVSEERYASRFSKAQRVRP